MLAACLASRTTFLGTILEGIQDMFIFKLDTSQCHISTGEAGKEAVAIQGLDSSPRLRI